MHDFTVVEFPKLGWSFNVPSILADFTIPGINLHLTIHWYGVIIAFGFLLAVLLGGRMAYKWKMSLDKMVDVLIFGTFGGIIGARLFYVIFEWEQYKDHLLDIFKIWEGGMAIYGGIIGGLLAGDEAETGAGAAGGWEDPKNHPPETCGTPCRRAGIFSETAAGLRQSHLRGG